MRKAFTLTGSERQRISQALGQHVASHKEGERGHHYALKLMHKWDTLPRNGILRVVGAELQSGTTLFRMKVDDGPVSFSLAVSVALFKDGRHVTVNGIPLRSLSGSLQAYVETQLDAMKLTGESSPLKIGRDK